MQFVMANMPDIITAWNSKFDIPYLVRKIFDYFDFEGLKSISPFNRISFKVKEALEFGIELDMDALIPGIDVIDMMELYKKNTDTQKPSYSLKNIAEEELGDTKLQLGEEDIDPTTIFFDDFFTFCEYNFKDVLLTVMLEEKLKLLNLSVIVRNISKTDFGDIFYKTKIIDNLFIMETFKRRANGEKMCIAI